MAALLALPAAGACLIAALARGRHAVRIALALALAATLGAAGALVTGVTSLPAHTTARFALSWVPDLDLEFALLGDQLSLFFAAAAIGIGALIVVYAGAYFRGHSPSPRLFYSVLLLFMTAMVGAVTADHLVVLYLFWELTGVASFLLIGTHHDEMDARIAARQAWLVTFATGLCLLAGLILLAQLAGDWRLSTILGGERAWIHDARAPLAIGLILVGALGKSAQVPFQFWLTGAMAAPTPVSAYLHSATMVKLGVYLCARCEPAFAAWPGWHALLLAGGWGTMMFAGMLALFAQDIKAALAFATISALGYLIGLHGTGAPEIAALGTFHIGNHALYKAALFMVAGAIVHATHTRDLRELGGMARARPGLAVITCVALAGMIGLPGTTGFVSKEEILRVLLERPGAGGLLTLFCAGTVLKVMFALRFFHAAFLGPAPHHVNAPDAAERGMAAPAGLLVGGLVLFGLLPQLTHGLLAGLPVAGRSGASPPEPQAWSGFTPGFFVSVGIMAAGAILYVSGAAARLWQRPLPRGLQWEHAHAWALECLDRVARRTLRGLQVDRPVTYLPWVVTTLTGAGAAVALWPAFSLGARLAAVTPVLAPWRWLIVAAITAAALGVTLFRLWTTQLLSLSVAGFLVCIYFAVFRAPDLALTQILVEALLLVLFVFLLARFPKSVERGEQPRPARGWTRVARPVLAIACGAGTTLALLTLSHPGADDPVGERYLALSQPETHAANAVNAIVVDFRGLDTLGESTVLIIALLGVLGLLMRFRRGRPRPAAREQPPATAGERAR
jgi:NADH:ubiquinone oxidoreductase subunit 5 (subunit L)/multisubunit Na+/H+ antiporter MnhA subunit